jgi:hypothetical protein
MIHIFFVPGTFGTTIEYIIRSYTKEYTGTNLKILDDGSMHSLTKEFHPRKFEDLHLVPERLNHRSITTPIYPFCNLKFPQVLKLYSSHIAQGHCILLHCDCLKDAELNCLFQYHKISYGTVANLGLGIFFDGLDNNVKQWNQSYRNWKDMQHWELREWFSLVYPQWVTEWIDSKNQVTNDWLLLSNSKILSDPTDSFLKIIKFCNLTPNEDIDLFAQTWKSKQQYVLDEFDLLDKIIYSTTHDRALTWQPINLIAEAILQQRFRSLNFEIMCDGLNTFPTDSETLYNLLEPV